MPHSAPQFNTLKQDVQHNCHIADANQAADYTLCVYLLKMRELYRWEQGRGYNQDLTTTSVGKWLRERENLWDQVSENDFRPLQIRNKSYDPFDNMAINEALTPYGLIYSGGLGINSRAHFFLGKLEQRHEYNSYRVFICAEEYARDLTSPPAMSQGNTIYIRREAVKRMLWEKYDTWKWNEPDNAMGRAIKAYNFTADVDAALDKMTDAELENILLHEIGEIRAGELLGEAWSRLIADIPHTKAELLLRAVRDNLADTISTLPALVKSNNAPSIHFYIGNLSNMRKHMFPGILAAYESWLQTGDTNEFEAIIHAGRKHWQQTALDALTLASSLSSSAEAAQKVTTLIEGRCL